MNKKVMAIAMAAVMLMVAVTVGVSAQSDADGSGTVGDPVYIAGSLSTKQTIYIGDLTAIKTTIQFNRSAFTDAAEVKMYLSDATGTEFGSVYNLGGSVTIGDDSGSVVTKISEVGDKSGLYKVSINGKTAGSVLLKIKITVEEKVPSTDPSTNVYFPPQEFYWAANLEVKKITGSISLSDLEFEYEKNVNLEAEISCVPSGETDWKYYATGLPDGLSMKVDGKIGGKLSKELKNNPPSDKKFTVYAVSSGGVVISEEFTYTIADAPDAPSFTMKNGDTPISDNGYVLQNVGKTAATISIEGINGATLANVEAKFNGNPVDITGPSGTNTASFSLDNVGTGTYEVVVTADLTRNDIITTVQQHFTVYVVGEIVDADLNPSVTSR